MTSKPSTTLAKSGRPRLDVANSTKPAAPPFAVFERFSLVGQGFFSVEEAENLSFSEGQRLVYPSCTRWGVRPPRACGGLGERARMGK
jgi:hypothetical protein